MNVNKNPLIFFVILFLIVESNSVFAANWTISPGITVTESYYDNITLQESNKNRELVTQVRPKLTVNGKGRRLKLNANYVLDYVHYYGDDFGDRLTHTAGLQSDAELINNNLFFGTTATVSQQSLDPLSAAPGRNNALVSNNRTETRAVSFTPRLQNKFGSFAYSVLSDTYSIVQFDDPGLSSYWINNLSYQLTSGSWFKKFTWQGDIATQHAELSNGNNLSVNGRMNYSFTRHWTVFAQGRAVKNEFLGNVRSAGVGRSLYFAVVLGGLQWAPSRKLLMEVGGGAILNPSALSNYDIEVERSTWLAKIVITPNTRSSAELSREEAVFGRKTNFILSHRGRKSTISSSYTETLSTPQQTLIGGLNNQATSSGSSFSFGELGRGLTDDVILRRRFALTGSTNRRAVGFDSNVFYEKGDYQTTDVSDSRYGGSVGLKAKPGRRTDITAEISAQQYDFDAFDRSDKIYSFGLGANRSLGKYVEVGVIYEWTKRTSNVNTIKYTANQVTVQITATY